ncbi:hypothetical protein BSL82_03930 [Tardibacter chloracetimidivorans]|uniref:Methyltransferase FkbM domain-containing protein n=1 Tax=Tardibacter chloracetimidivorans TaxID=1921510 RepID=A0A1L3ZSF4_9SPHN|nr:hypothetical protein BSL82_03930 [Tardibacter chloracetimidivorans]
MARVARACDAYLWYFHNQNNFDFECNGERRVMETVNRWRQGLTVWDVGAHTGEWATVARQRLDGAKLVSFEIVPRIHEQLADTVEHQTFNCGLSDQDGTVSVAWSKDFDTSNSINPRVGSKFFDGNVEMVECQVVRGDRLIEEGQAPAPQFLKIDTEGHDVAVLRGLSRLVASEDAPSIIQMEYGETYLPGGFTLKNIYDILEPHGYAIGKVYPNYVDFRPYEYKLDDFRLGNVVAVNDPKLQAALGA